MRCLSPPRSRVFPALPVLLPLLVPVLFSLLAACGGPEPRPRNLLLVTLDTTRADHLTPYGYDRPTSPALAALAEDAIVFDHAFAQETNTNPSHASMFTGLYPHHHGNRENGQVLAPERLTLARILHAAGFRTAAFISGFTMTSRATGFERGFELYEDRLEAPRRSGAETVDRALAWLGRRGEGGIREGERFFLFVHLFDAHGPYQPPAETAALFQSPEPGPLLDEIPSFQLRRDEAGREIRHLNPYLDAYDGALRYQDEQLGRLLAAVDLDETLVVVLADHGETLGERHWDLGHGGQVFDEQIRIPWLIAGPGLAPGRVGAMVETVDLLPTVLEALELKAPDRPLDGRSLMPLLRTGSEVAASGEPFRRAVFASARAESRRHADRGYELDGGRRIVAVRTARHKLILYPGLAGDYRELYDLSADPGEKENCLAGAPELAATLEKVLGAWLAGAPREVAMPDLPEEDLRRLRALGYLDG